MSFDKEAFTSLIDDDKDLFQSLIQLFGDEWPNIVNSLRDAVEKKDFTALEHAGHRIKGNLRNFYSNELAKLALDIELAGRNSDLNDIVEKIDQLEVGLRQLELDLKTYYESFN